MNNKGVNVNVPRGSTRAAQRDLRPICVGGLAIVLLLLGPGARAGGHVDTFVAFDPAAGEFPEGVAFDKVGNVYVSLLDLPGDEVELRQIRKIDPSGVQSVLADFDIDGFGPAGLKVDARGIVYAAVNGIDFRGQQDLDPENPELPDTHGAYRVLPDGTTEHLAGTQEMLFPNDVTLDKLGNLYITDTMDGAVWRVPRGAAGMGPAELWLRHNLLEGDERFGIGFPLGANGIAVRHNRILVANTELGRLVEIPIRPDGSAGKPSVLVESPALVGVDGIALGARGNIYAALNIHSSVVRVERDGSVTTVATEDDGLDSSSTLAFGTGRADHRTLYVANFSFFSRCCPALLKLRVGEPGQPVP